MTRYLIAVALFWLTACTRQTAPAPVTAIPEPQTDYERRLVATKSAFQFQHWPARARPAVVAVFDRLLRNLLIAGESASEAQKVECFARAVAELNEINRRDRTIIETSEAEQLVDIGNQVAKAVGLDPKRYGHGEGPLSAGRDW